MYEITAEESFTDQSGGMGYPDTRYLDYIFRQKSNNLNYESCIPDSRTVSTQIYPNHQPFRPQDLAQQSVHLNVYPSGSNTTRSHLQSPLVTDFHLPSLQEQSPQISPIYSDSLSHTASSAPDTPQLPYGYDSHDQHHDISQLDIQAPPHPILPSQPLHAEHLSHHAPYPQSGLGFNDPPKILEDLASKNNKRQRVRRQADKIERLYGCGWNGCEKSYGTLSHLNEHVLRNAHGPRRTPQEFPGIRKRFREAKASARSKAGQEVRKNKFVIKQPITPAFYVSCFDSTPSTTVPSPERPAPEPQVPILEPAVILSDNTTYNREGSYHREGSYRPESSHHDWEGSPWAAPKDNFMGQQFFPREHVLHSST